MSPTSNLHTLTSAIFTHLPRELRDEVYSQIWDTSTVAQLPYMGPLRASRKPPSYTTTTNDDPYPADLKPDFLDHASGLVPQRFAAKVVEWLYTKSPDFAPQLHGFSEVPLYLKTDLLDVGVTPLSVPIHHFSIRVHLGEISSPVVRNVQAFQEQLELLPRHSTRSRAE
ncbi:hypothetical protein K491DRAFT_728807 [Lophiostoma macrostomum CBS 122681]|uniref:Uncharacterized protein n=1 Tax=Lophiostoma macrostomum CBS 122681 TaxID=1314788 RepID=A0A6A6SXN7_9PLEO|nr:hypothetical protein K491DRAFT_728807 [Lophiostoma macrostomum CBS 122681]